MVLLIQLLSRTWLLRRGEELSNNKEAPFYYSSALYRAVNKKGVACATPQYN